MDINLLADLEKRDIPAATIGWEVAKETISSVMVDNEAGAKLALEHLYLLGHRRIAFIRGPKRLIYTAPRWKGIRKFAQSVGMKIDTSMVVDLPESFHPNSGFESGFQLTEDLLKRRKRFSALLAFDDLTAFGAIQALTKAGFNVPEQCSVVGFDDIALSAISAPSLTTIRQPLETMGTMAVNIVMDEITANREKREVNVVHLKTVPELVVRDSTRAVLHSASVS